MQYILNKIALYYLNTQQQTKITNYIMKVKNVKK